MELQTGVPYLKEAHFSVSRAFLSSIHLPDEQFQVTSRCLRLASTENVPNLQ